VFAAALPYADRAVVTEIDVEVEGDTTAPRLPPGWHAVSADPEEGWHRSSTGLGYRVVTYVRPGL